jgi:hypothetical protein
VTFSLCGIAHFGRCHAVFAAKSAIEMREVGKSNLKSDIGDFEYPLPRIAQQFRGAREPFVEKMR